MWSWYMITGQLSSGFLRACIYQQRHAQFHIVPLVAQGSVSDHKNGLFGDVSPYFKHMFKRCLSYFFLLGDVSPYLKKTQICFLHIEMVGVCRSSIKTENAACGMWMIYMYKYILKYLNRVTWYHFPGVYPSNVQGPQQCAGNRQWEISVGSRGTSEPNRPFKGLVVGDAKCFLQALPGIHGGYGFNRGYLA